MADLTKIVPTSITSNLTVSEVNGISLTKSKQNGDSTLPATTFAEILEAQLSQNNLQTVDSTTDAKQILPGQSVDPSLFGSLIVVVRDVEVPITENQDTPTTNENSRLFIPTVFTASTSSVISVGQLPKQEANNVSNINDSSNTPSDITTNLTSTITTEKPNKQQPTTETIQSGNTNPQVTIEGTKTPLEENLKASLNETQIVDPVLPAQTSVVIPLNTTVTQQPIAVNTISVDKDKNRDTENVTSKDSLTSQLAPNDLTNRNQVIESFSPTLQVSDNNQENKNFIQTQNTATVEPISNRPQKSIEQNTEQVKSTQYASETSPRTLSSMLQSVQGLKMGIERTPTHQTYITVALPISEVQRLVVANPEVFTANQQVETIDTSKNSLDNINESNNVAVSTKTNEGTINNNSDKASTTIIENSNPIVQNISTVVQTQNREDLFVPTSFVPQDFSDISHSSQQPPKTEVSVPNTIKPEVIAPKQESNIISSQSIPNSQQKDTLQSGEKAEIESVKIDSKVVQDVVPTQTPLRPTENTFVNKFATTPEQKSIESVATVIENFATNLQTISSPKVTTPLQNNSTYSTTKNKEQVEFPFQAKIETISEKNTLVLEPIQKEIVTQLHKKVDQVIEPKHTISQLLQKAEAEGITIESIVVKIPVQSTKNSEFQKESTVTSYQQPVASTITNETPILSKSTVVPNVENEAGTPTNLSLPTKATQDSKVIQSPTIQTLVQNDNIINVSKNVIESRPAENTVSKPTIVQNEATNLNRIGKEINTLQTETNSNPKSENGNLPTRRDVSSILQRVETIQQKSAPIEEKNVVSTTSSIDNTTSVPATAPKSTTSFPSISPERTPSVEETLEQPIESKDTIVLEDSPEKEVTKDTVNNTITGMAPAIKTTSSMIPTMETKVFEVPVTIEELPEAIVQEFVTDTTAKGSKATFTLNPEQLGKVQVEVNVQGNNASITLESSHKETIPMLEKQIDTLKEQLKTSNINVEKLEILFKPVEIVQPTSTMSDTFTSSQQMEQQSMQQEIDRQAQQQRKNNHQERSIESENSVDDIQPKRFGDGSSIIEEYI